MTRILVGRAVALAAVCLYLFPLTIAAQDTAELLARIKAMEERIQSLETEVQTLKGQQAAVVPGTPAPVANAPAAVSQAAPPVPEATPQVPVNLGGAGGAAAKALNPDVAVIGDFLGAAGNGAGRGTPSLEMHESEIALQAILDPYARADFFFSFGEEGVTLEEGYLTFPALPGGFQLRVGKMRGIR